MATKLNPYITYDGDARAALEFYQSVLGGELTVNTYGEFGMPDPAFAGTLMHGRLETPDGFTLMGADTPPDSPHNPGTNVVISLSGDERDKLHGWFTRLAEGGAVSVPLEKQMWGDEYGAFRDRFGIEWMVNIG